MTISRNNLTEQVSEKVGSVPNLFKIVTALFDTIVENLEEGNEVNIHNFGTFKVVAKAERKGRNPQTGAEITIPAHNLPIFKPSKFFKDAVN